MPRPGWADAGEPALLDPDALDTLPDMFGSSEAHLYDYCRALSGQDADAARAARSAVDSVDASQQDPDRLRARFFTRGRRQALALRPPGCDDPTYLPSALLAGSDQQDNGVLRAFRAVNDGDREILDLVYRHGIRPSNLAEVLGIPAAEAYRRLALAEEEFISLVSEPPGSDASSAGSADAKLEDIAALPLAALPEKVAPPATRLWHGSRLIHRRPAQLAAAAVISAVTIGAAAYFAASSRPIGSQAATLPGNGAGVAGQRAAAPGTAHVGRQGEARRRPAAGQPGYLGVPVASPTTAAVPNAASSGAAITGIPVTPNPVPCPTGTKANVRWHYTAGGSAGGWSGTASQACPGSISIGPQAMDGNLQVAPGATLNAGYDLTIPGDNNSVFVTFTHPRVAFKVKCANGIAPTTSTVTVPMATRTYHSTNGGTWYPSGDQSSSLTYQGSISVPNVCSGSKVTFQNGGTFTATIS